MKNNLVIVESPSKAKTLEKFLGPDYAVTASGGHIRDLPVKTIGINFEKNFEPKYETLKGREKIIKEIKSLSSKAKNILLAPDPDREGEAIAWHLAYVIDNDKKVKRIEFNEITKEAVLAAVKHPRKIDMNRVDAQQARRILDRIVGYKISPLLWKKVQKGLSAGRVQSIAVRLICEREALVQKFVPQEYWKITSWFLKEGLPAGRQGAKQPFSAFLHSRSEKQISINNKDEADTILKDLEGSKFEVAEVRKREQKKNPYPPFITSSLQQDASRKLGYPAKKTMSIAQRLYEGIEITDEGSVGLITYMRTDSVRTADVAIEEVRKYIKDNFSPEHLPKTPNAYKTKKSAQDAHEAIRPTSVMRSPEKIKKDLSPEQFKLYELIWRRFLSSQMTPAVSDVTSIDIKAKDYLFRATGSIMRFKGYLSVYDESKDVEEENGGELPDLEKGESLIADKVVPSQHFTEPPPRYNEASLIKELEERGIGRPSTYAPIISTVVDRGYVTREGKALKPTSLGVVTNSLLVKHFPVILDIEFTAKMEEELDEIEEGKIKWTKTLEEFYEPFSKSLEKANIEMKKVKMEEKTDEICEKCGKPMVVRQSRYGGFLACTGFPKCKNTRNLLKAGEEMEEIKEVCPKCGSPMQAKRSRFGLFLACTAYPKCKTTLSVSKKTGVKCPEQGCGGDIVERKSKRGRMFFSCSNYPKCKFAVWQKPLLENCPNCGAFLTEKRAKGEISKECSKKCGYTSQ